MFLTNLNAKIVACILLFGKSRHKPNLKSTSEYGFPPIWGENRGVLSMCMQVILDSVFARPGSAPIWGEKKGEFRDWTIDLACKKISFHFNIKIERPTH